MNISMQKYARDGKIHDACPNAELRSVQGRKGHARSTERPKEVDFPLNCKSSIDNNGRRNSGVSALGRISQTQSRPSNP